MPSIHLILHWSPRLYNKIFVLLLAQEQLCLTAVNNDRQFGIHTLIGALADALTRHPKPSYTWHSKFSFLFLFLFYFNQIIQE